MPAVADPSVDDPASVDPYAALGFDDLIPGAPSPQSSPTGRGGDGAASVSFDDLVPATPTSATQAAVTVAPTAGTPAGNGISFADLIPPDPAPATDAVVASKTLEHSALDVTWNAIKAGGVAVGQSLMRTGEGIAHGRAEHFMDPPTTRQASPGAGRNAAGAEYAAMTTGEPLSPGEQEQQAQLYGESMRNALTAQNILRGRELSMPSESNLDPALENHPVTKIARGIAQGGQLALEAAVPVVGLPLMATQGMFDTYAKALNEGESEEAAQMAASKSLIGLAIFGAANKAMAAGLNAVLPEGAGAVTRFVTHFLGQSAGNEATLRAMQAYDAADAAPAGHKMAAATDALTAPVNLENTAMNVGFAALGAAHEAGAARHLNISTPSREQEAPAAPDATSETPVVARDLPQGVSDSGPQPEPTATTGGEASPLTMAEIEIAHARSAAGDERYHVIDHGTAAASIRLEDNPSEDAFHIEDIGSTAHGGGRALMGEIEAFAAQHGKGLTWSATPESAGFYEALGYQPESFMGHDALKFHASPAEIRARALKGTVEPLPPVPEGSLKTHDEYGQPMTRVVVPDEIAGQAKPIGDSTTQGGEGAQAVANESSGQPQSKTTASAEEQPPSPASPQAGNTKPPEQGQSFTPSTEWQEVPDGAVLPNGGEYRFDQASGKNYARWSPENVEAAQADARYSGLSPKSTETGDATARPEDTLLQSLGAETRAPVRERIEAKIKSGSQVVRDVVAESQKQHLVAPGTGGARTTAEWLSDVWKQVRDVPRFTQFKEALFKFGKELQTAFLDGNEIKRRLMKAVPDKTAREGIFNHMEAGGDRRLLETWARDATDPKLKRGYEAALKLTPEQIDLADKLSQFYKDKLREAKDNNIVRDGVENYINRIVDKRRSRGFKDTGGPVGIDTGKFSTSFRHAARRQYEYAFDAERNGIRYVSKDIAELAPIYSAELNRAIATRKFIEDLTGATAKDGRALAYPKGSLTKLEDATGNLDGRVIKPNTKQKVANEITGEDESSRDYVTVQHPALNAHKWIGEDENGKPILMRGDLALHPEIAQHVKNIVGGSAIRKWYNSPGSALAAMPKFMVRQIDTLNSTAKQFLFSGSGFHHMTMATKGHMVGAEPIRNFVKSLSGNATIDPHEPHTADWMAHGLQLAPDYASASKFMEGFSGPTVEKIPLYGPYVRAVSQQLFERFIPAMKLTLADRTYERYQKSFAKELANADVSEGQLKAAAADYANKALSHQNYLSIGRSPTVQHILSLGLLAPDFNESRFKYLGDVAAGLTGSKVARPALKSFTYGMVATYVAMRVLNQLIDGDPHLEPEHAFDIVHGNRTYSIRTIQGDLFKMIGAVRGLAQGDITGTSGFLGGRLSPIAKFVGQMFYPVNYRGEKITGGEAAKEFIASYVPIWAKSLPGARELTQTSRQNPVSPLEQFMTATGFHIARNDATTQAYRLAAEWKTGQGIPKDTGVYPTSKYQQLRYALADADLDRAQQEYQKLKDAGETPMKIAQGFKQSVGAPFTGSAASDIKFRNSLSGDDRTVLNAAVKQRQEILARFQGLRR